jgi:hypothetical protein
VCNPEKRNTFRRYAGLLLILPLILIWNAAAAADPIGNNDKEVRAFADPILVNLLAGFNDGNYAKYSRDFSPTLLEAISAKKFQQVREDILKKIGKYQSRQYLGFYQYNRTTVVLWKGRFSDTDNDVLIKLVVSKRKDKNLVVGLWFQ